MLSGVTVVSTVGAVTCLDTVVVVSTASITWVGTVSIGIESTLVVSLRMTLGILIGRSSVVM